MTICAIYGFIEGFSLQDMIGVNTPFIKPYQPRYLSPLPNGVVSFDTRVSHERAYRAGSVRFGGRFSKSLVFLYLSILI